MRASKKRVLSSPYEVEQRTPLLLVAGIPFWSGDFPLFSGRSPLLDKERLSVALPAPFLKKFLPFRSSPKRIFSLSGLLFVPERMVFVLFHLRVLAALSTSCKVLLFSFSLGASRRLPFCRLAVLRSPKAPRPSPRGIRFFSFYAEWKAHVSPFFFRKLFLFIVPSCRLYEPRSWWRKGADILFGEDPTPSSFF